MDHAHSLTEREINCPRTVAQQSWVRTSAGNFKIWRTVLTWRTLEPAPTWTKSAPSFKTRRTASSSRYILHRKCDSKLQFGWFGTSVTKLGDFLHFGNYSKPLATIILPKLPTLLGNFCKGAKIIHFSCEIISGQL